MRVFSAEFGGVLHPPMIGFKQSVRVSSVEFSLPASLREFSPSGVYHCAVCRVKPLTLYSDIQCIGITRPNIRL